MDSARDSEPSTQRRLSVESIAGNLPGRACESVVPISWDTLGSLGGLLKRRLPATSMKDSLSSKDNRIETRTKIIVGVIP